MDILLLMAKSAMEVELEDQVLVGLIQVQLEVGVEEVVEEVEWDGVLVVHLGVMDIPPIWYEQNANASTVRIDVTTTDVNANFKPIVRRYMRADTDTKIAMMNKIKHLIKEKLITVQI